MTEETMLEVVIETKDEDLVREVEAAIADANPTRWKDTRDILTVITIVSSSVGLVNSLLTLKDHLAKRRDAPRVVVRNADRDACDLADAEPDELDALVAGRPDA